MREISLHILDIVQNSIAAGATRIEIVVDADRERDLLLVRVHDNGRGMSPEVIERARSPFWTTRTTRKVGLGIPMLTAAAEMCGGEVRIASREGEGTTIEAEFGLSHIDRAPLGDMIGTMVTLIVANPDISIRYEHSVDGRSFALDMEEVRQVLGDVSVQAEPVVQWLRDYLAEGIAQTGAIP